ncbi:crotonase/enoyl-CoA hydratase family protein [Microvirga sp. HBU67558]|uniref:crotonase/enoyl-CoA hydratase family protein n=1 Tax=Microvirga TaxID=186650 RepID=UPI001B362A55|nr:MULTISPECIES: crotonase/enoyl-CoA hydratase family protein [unclassified Microvirga]MBQ0823229.1 crotonase/enoyl-CoA hydratase family protein [Microvirga sp. HBU67558]
MLAPSAKVAGPVRDEAQTVDYEVASPPASPSRKPNPAPSDGSPTNLLLPHIDVNIDFESRIYWAAMRPSRHPMITMELLQDMMCVQESVRVIMEEGNREQHQHLEYFVAASQTPGVYNFGGNLAYFADCIRRRDRDGLRKYAYACIDVVYGNAMAFHTPLITIALVQGDALGGGFECALSFDVLVAEKSAKLGLPEVLFNLFPGMGAYSFLSRKIGTAAAEKLIMSGTVYTAEELHRLGVVDILADDGQGENAVRDYIARNRRKHNAHKAMYRSKRRINPLTYEELSDIVDIWLDAAMDLGEQDLRKMTRLVEAQARRFDKGI